jgi:hypothetical protein
MGNCVQKEAAVNKRKYNLIPDQYETWDQLSDALQAQNIEGVQMVIGIDYTQSNEWQGKRTFGGRCLHAPYYGADEKRDNDGEGLASAPPSYSPTQPGTTTYEPVQCGQYLQAPQQPVQRMGTQTNYQQLNHYEYAMTVLAKPLKRFDADGDIPTYGFGSEECGSNYVTPLTDNPAGCRYLEGVLAAYQQMTPRMVLSGGTSFAPIINKTIEWTKRTGEYHICVIFTDGCISDGKAHHETVQAIAEASNHPISIIIVGVGDGDTPKARDGKYWAKMNQFDDDFNDICDKLKVSRRKFDNVQFIDAVALKQKCQRYKNPEVAFATHALMEVPDQYDYIKQFILPTYGP